VTAKKGSGARSERQHGIPGDRYVVELRGRQYFVVDAITSMTAGGPYIDRNTAQLRADQLNRAVWGR
jgi:hypothetical protein